jgi:KUP system potassium uptake protein
MLMTSVLLFIAMREIWGWGVVAAGGVAGALLVVDAAFVAANLMKVEDGGWVPIVLAVLVYGVMYVWHKGTAAVAARLSEAVQPIATVMEQVARDQVPRVPGTAVFLTRTERDAPPAMLWHLKHSRALHRQVVIVNVQTGSVPWVAEDRRLQVEQIATEVWRLRSRFGFMERPDLPALLRQAQEVGCAVDLSDVTYFVGHETVVPSEDRGGLPRWMEIGFAFLQRNSTHVTDYFRLPVDNVVEIGREVAV